MRKLSMAELNRLSPAQFNEAPKFPFVVVLDDIRSLNNIGSFFRTADAFRIQAIYLCGITATPPHRDIHKTALGATESVSWQYFNKVEDGLNNLKLHGYQIISVEQTTQSLTLSKLKIEKPTALVFGNEVDGVSEAALQRSDLAVEIPQSGTKHSLNVAVCGGIVLWHCFSQLSITSN